VRVLCPLFAALLLAGFWSKALGATPTFEPRECSSDLGGARCGVVQVPEDHSRPQGRKIALKVLVLPATGKVQDSKRAQYDLEGGPGLPATAFLEFYAGDGAIYREHRDIVLADMRGTGGSTPLRCPAIEARKQDQPALLRFPPDLVAECARELSRTLDPAQYTTAAASKDIDLVRRALGYQQLDLNAVSYGTTLALRYIADFPRHVHGAVLMSAVPASAMPPRSHAQAAEAALVRLAADCAADLTCRRNGDFDTNLARSRSNAASAEPLTDATFMEQLRVMLYTPAGRARVPYLVHLAAEGDFSAFIKPATAGNFADGLYLSVVCGESFARMDLPSAITKARVTRFGAYRLEMLRAACEQWPTPRADRDLLVEKPSDVPVLFLSGALDPVSPPAWAAATSKRFRHARMIMAPQGAHVYDGLSNLDTCLDATMLRFMDAGSAQGLEESCFAQMRAPPFDAPQ
jgi:pimeloyl-ACP methyl ester carboxylesterase